VRLETRKADWPRGGEKGLVERDWPERAGEKEKKKDAEAKKRGRAKVHQELDRSVSVSRKGEEGGREAAKIKPARKKGGLRESCPATRPDGHVDRQAGKGKRGLNGKQGTLRANDMAYSRKEGKVIEKDAPLAGRREAGRREKKKSSPGRDDKPYCSRS